MAALLEQNGVAGVTSEDAHIVPRAADDGRADEDGLELAGRGALFEGGLGGDFGDAAIDLATVAVALDRDIDEAEAFLRRAGDFVGHEDGAGTGSEDRLTAAEF